MNGPGHRLLLEAAALNGELRKMLLALGLTLLIALALAALTECGAPRRIANRLAWCGAGGLLLAGAGGLTLVALGLL